MTGVPDISLTSKPAKNIKNYHSGRWIKYPGDNIELWSCCANQYKDSIVILILF